MFRAGIDHGLLLRRRERTKRQCHGDNLVGPQQRVVAEPGRIDDVIAAPALRIPKFLKPVFRFLRMRVIRFAGFLEQVREPRHRLQRINPQGIDFDGLAGARRHHPIADFCVHPGELHPRFTRVQQTVRGVHMDVIARALHVRVDYFR